jgi:hypothetical protein
VPLWIIHLIEVECDSLREVAQTFVDGAASDPQNSKNLCWSQNRHFRTGNEHAAARTQGHGLGGVLHIVFGSPTRLPI